MLLISDRLSFRNGLPFVITFHSKWLSIRNGFGITPKCPMGPPPRAPKGALGSPLDPLGSLVPLGSLGPLPLDPLGPLGGGVPGVPSGPRDRHLVEARNGRLEL